MPEAQESEKLVGLTGPKIHMQASQKRIDLASFSPDDVDLADICYLLPRVFRFNGNTVRPISVAEHSITVYQMVTQYTAGRDLEASLSALMHDATEAYIGDIPSPVKAMVPGVKEFEDGVIWPAIVEKFDLHPELPAVVHHCDRVAFYAEAMCLCDVSPDDPITGWGGYEEYGVAAEQWLAAHGRMARDTMPHPQMVQKVFTEIFEALIHARRDVQ